MLPIRSIRSICQMEKVSYRFDKCGCRSDNCISLVTTATRCMTIRSIGGNDYFILDFTLKICRTGGYTWMTTINKWTAKAWGTTNKNKPNMYTSFSKRERQYDPCRAKRQQTSQKCIPRSLSVSDNMTRVERKELTIAKACATIAKACAELTI